MNKRQYTHTHTYTWTYPLPNHTGVRSMVNNKLYFMHNFYSIDILTLNPKYFLPSHRHRILFLLVVIVVSFLVCISLSPLYNIKDIVSCFMFDFYILRVTFVRLYTKDSQISENLFAMLCMPWEKSIKIWIWKVCITQFYKNILFLSCFFFASTSSRSYVLIWFFVFFSNCLFPFIDFTS